MEKEETVDYYIKYAWHAISRMYNQKAQAYGLSTSMAFVLLNIHPDFGTRATKIAPLIGLETTSLARMLKNMEEGGLIERRSDPLDGRAVRIFLTSEGKKKKEIAMETVATFNKEIAKQISRKEFNSFVKVFEKINKVLENINL